MMQAVEYTPVGASSNIAPHAGGSQKSPAHGGALIDKEPWGSLARNFRHASRVTVPGWMLFAV